MAAVVEKIISEVKQEFHECLKQYILEDIREIPKKGNDISKQGAYGRIVYLDWSGTTCVGKVLHSVFFTSAQQSGMRELVKKFFKEIKLLSQMKHPNIVRFLGLYYEQDLSLPVLVMERMEYSLTEYLDSHEKGSIPENKVLGILLDVSRGLFYLHEERKVAHRDLSSNNILLAADLSAKIADLGSARVLDRPGGWDTSAKLTTQPGIVDFMPPEALLGNPQYTVFVDMFSFGCVIIHLSTHRWPTPIPVPKGEFITEIERRKEYILEMAGSHLLPMVEKCLEETSTNRPASADVMSLLQAKVEEGKLSYRRQGKIRWAKLSQIPPN